MIKDQTFPKTFRLLKPDDFQIVYKQGQWVANRELVANFVRHEKSFSRLGVTVSKKVSKRAVDRNRIKRQFREWFRSNKEVCTSIDLVLTAKLSLNTKSNVEIQKSLEDLWRKIQKK